MDSVYLHTLNPYAIHLWGSFGIRWYGLSYLAGFLAGYFIMRCLSSRGLSTLPVERVSDFVFAVALGTIIGGRIGYCVFYSPQLLVQISATPPFWGVLAINEGGMASHGGIIGIIVACFLFAHRHNLKTSHLFDLTTLGGTLGIFFGRIANFVNGELVGRPVESAVPWAVKFPQDILAWPSHEPARLTSLGAVAEAVGIPRSDWNSWSVSLAIDRHSWISLENGLYRIVQAIQDGNRVAGELLAPHLTARHPSQLYEALLEGAFLFLALGFIWRKPRKPGVIAGWFFTLYSAVRIIGEQFRMPDAHIGFQLFGLTRGQWLSIIMLALGVATLIIWSRRSEEKIGGWAYGRHS